MSGFVASWPHSAATAHAVCAGTGVQGQDACNPCGTPSVPPPWDQATQNAPKAVRGAPSMSCTHPASAACQLPSPRP